MAIYNQAHVFMAQVKFLKNQATMLSGGGAFASFHMTTAVFVDCLFEGNRVELAGGGALAAYGPGAPLITLSGCNVQGNSVPQGVGGGLFCDGNSKILIKNGTIIANNTNAIQQAHHCSVVVTERSKILNNTVTTGLAGGGIALMDYANLTVNGDSVIQGNNALSGSGGGAIYSTASSYVVLDSARILLNAASIGGGVHVSGNSHLLIKGKAFFYNNTAPVGPDLYVGPLASLTIKGGNLDPYGKTVLWQRTQCISGEVLEQAVCRTCLPSTYSLVPGPNAVCHVCPENAVCASGGDSIVPEAGYWHSDQYSTQIHRCPHVDAVCHPDSICAAGYSGNLCGVCEAGYGTSTAFSCGRCMAKGVQWALYLAAGLLAVLLVAFTVHSTWRDNHNKSSYQQLVRPSDIIKVLILFLQYLVILSSLSVPWPTALAYLFRIATFIFAASNGQLGSVSLGCVLLQGSESSVPASIQRQLIYTVAPIGILAGVVLLFVAKALILRALQATKLKGTIVHRGSGTSTIRRGSSTSSAGSVGSGAHLMHTGIGSMVLKKLPLMCVVTFFFAYPFLVRVSLGMFACLKLDRADAPNDPYPQFAVANASYGYWVHAMEQACFEGWHLPWALGLGLPSALLFCVGTPLALLIGLTVNKSKLQRADVRAQFGFLYRPYTEKRCWWEGVMTVQTMLLVTVSVFRYTLGGYYSALLVTVMFSIMAVLQLIFKPFASQRLHVMQLVATGCLYATSCIAQSLFSVDIGNSAIYREAIGIVAVILNVAFVMWCCYCILAESKGLLGGLYGGLKRLCAKCCPRLCGNMSSSSSSSSPGGAAVKAAESVPADVDGDVDGDSDQVSHVIARASPTQMPALPNV